MLHEDMDPNNPEKEPETPIKEPAAPDTEPEPAVVKPEETEQDRIDPRDAQIAQLNADREALKDEMVRALAEAQNIQRRLREQHAQAVKYASEPLIHDLLPVLDNFERTLAAFEKGASAEKLLKGVQQIEKQLRQALKKAKVERIDAVGKKFDPDFHEALATTVSEDHDDETVTAEIEPGYKMRDRVIRPARVQVTKKK